jgi:hypothetical protein
MRKIGIVSILLSGLFTIVQQKTVEHPDGSVTTEKKVDTQRIP